MEVSKENSSNAFIEVDLGSSAESFQRFLDSQKELLHSQIDQLQKIVVTQCKLTGVNPLSQEMAAGALSIKIGKRPRDLLNPKAIKYMLSVFSIKDNISKKEIREISALCGVTVTQVKEVFAGQRSRVRRLVRLSREKTIRNNACKESPDGVSTTSDSAMPIGDDTPAKPVDPQATEEGPSCSSQDETIPSIDPSGRNFVENIFNLMRKEETFAGQVKLMEWILQIHDSMVLCWFLTKGGTMILATWLNQAALEEQTTVLVVIFKVLCHLPLHKALPVQMSAILQSVNRLRFYRTSDISNRARVLLSRWSKLFVRSQSIKRPSSKSPKDAQKEIIRKQRISEILSDESWQSKIDIPEEIRALTYGNLEDCRNPEPSRGLTVLHASSDDSNKKQVRSVSSPQTKERRKVLLVEQPGRKTSGRTVQVMRAAPANQGRPMSADDIQKAKMRAIFMQSKYGKTSVSSNQNPQQKTADPNTSSPSKTGNIFPASRTLLPRREEDRKAAVASPETSHTLAETLMPLQSCSAPQEPLWEKLKRAQIPWQTPPEMVINSLWSVSAGEKSKEVEVQTERLRRGKETFYRTVHDIPSNPNEPWDIEMGFDDTLTPEIPIEQPPDADGAEVSSSPRNSGNTEYPSAAAAPAVISNGNSEPDLELLAVLLKNPQLVFALTSGQGNNGLTSADTVALLDLLKNSGIGLAGISNGLTANAMEKPEITSMPSPTPSSDPPTSAWRPVSTYQQQFSGNSISQPVLPGNRGVTSFPAMTPSTSMTVAPLPETLPVLSVQQSLIPPNPSSQDQPVTNSMATGAHQIPATSFPVTQIPASAMPEKQLPTIIPAPQFPAKIAPLQHTQISDPVLPANNFSITSSSPLLQNILAAGSPSQHLTMPPQEAFNIRQTHNQKPLSSSVFSNLEEKPGRSLPLMTPLVPNPPRSQPPLLPEPVSFAPPLFPTWIPNAPKPPSVPEFRNNRPKSLSEAPSLNPHCSSNQNNYNIFPAGPTRQPPVLPGPAGDGNEYLGEPELEMWSPERSPVRSPDFHSGRNFPEPRRNFSEPRRGYGRNHRHQWPRERNSGHRDHRAGNRRWRDRRY